jgi:hypothetical protein
MKPFNKGLKSNCRQVNSVVAMENKKLLLFNAVMVFFLFLSSQFVLLLLNGKIVQGIGLFIEAVFPVTPGYPPPPTVAEPLPNYPLLIFLAMLIVNLSYFVYIKLWNKKILN